MSRRLVAELTRGAVRVVEANGSKKSWTMVRPRRAGTFLTSRAETCLKDLAVSKIISISSLDKLLKSNKSRFI